MKRLALVLGSLLVVTAATSAKEVVPAPIVVEEAPVQIVEKEVIVYREKAPEWRPTGNIALEGRYYSKTENNDARDGQVWTAGNNEYLRIQTNANVKFTPNDKLAIRVRDYEGMVSASKNPMGKKDQYRLRYTHDFGKIADTKIGSASRLEYQRNNGGSQHAEVRGIFDFTEYMFSNDYVKTTGFTVEPAFKHAWESNGHTDDFTNSVEVKFGMTHDLPYGFSTEFNLYVRELHYNIKHVEANDTDKTFKNDTQVEFEAYVYNTQNLYTADDLSIDFNFEGGYDPYTWTHKGYEGYKNNTKKDHVTYTLYAEPSIGLTYNATKFVTLTTGVGAKYSNFAFENEHKAQDWRWQPFAYAGFNVAF